MGAAAALGAFRFAAIVAGIAAVPIAIGTVARVPVALVVPVVPVAQVATVEALVVVALSFVRAIEIVVAVLKTRFVIRRAVIRIVFAVVAAMAPLLLETGPAFPKHPVVMLGILKIIFGLHPVSRKLRIPSHALVLLEQLGGVAALATVLAIAARLPTDIRPLPSTAAPAAALTIIDQSDFPQKQKAPRFCRRARPGEHSRQT